jgi:hypothetical protein
MLTDFKPIPIKEHKRKDRSILPCHNCWSTKDMKSGYSYTEFYGDKIVTFEISCDKCGICVYKEGIDCRARAVDEWNRMYRNTHGRCRK